MADNYLQFSEMLETKDKAERVWLNHQLDYIVVEAGKVYLLDENPSAEDETPDAEDTTWDGPRFLHMSSETWKLLKGIEGFENDCGDTGFSWDLNEDGLWIHAEEGGNPGTAAVLVQAFFKKFHPNGIWKLEWAETCSKPRLSALGGGAVVVTANDMYWMTTGTFTSEKISELIDKEGLKEHVSDST